MFNYPTIRALTDYLLKEVLQFDSPPAPEQTALIHVATPAKTASVDQSSDGLSEDEISILLMEKLEQMKCALDAFSKSDSINPPYRRYTWRLEYYEPQNHSLDRRRSDESACSLSPFLPASFR